MVPRFLRYTLAAFRIPLLIIPMAICIFLYLLFSKFLFKHTPERAFRLRRIYLRYTNFILGIKSTVTGYPVESTALYVSNHRSLSDPFIMCLYIDAYIIAKAEVASYPLISTGAQMTGILYVKREDQSSRYAVREKMKQTLLESENVLVYPEGTVNDKMHTLPYRPGTFKEAVAMKIPLVPVCIEYRKAKDLWHNRSTLAHYFLQFGYWRTESRIVIGPEIHAENGEQLCKIAEDWTNKTIREIHSDWKGSHFNPSSPR